MKTVFFVRHGQSEANSLGIAAGSEFDTPLTDNGRAQAKKTGQELIGKGIDLIVASPMARAVETAKIIASEIDYDVNKVIVKPYFNERNFGIYSQGPDAEYSKAVLGNKPLHESVEPVEAMHKRVTEGLEWLSKQNAENILLVGHGGTSRVLRLIHQDLPHTHMYKLERLENAAVYEFTL